MLAPDRSLVVTAFILGAALATSAAASATEPAPHERWEVNYGSTKCRLIRHFGPVGQGNRITVERGWSFGGYDWKLYGKEVPAYSSAAPITVTLTPPVRTHSFKTNPYMFDEGDERGIGWNDPDAVLFGALRDDLSLRVVGPKKLDFQLPLPKVRSAISALEICENGLYASWGIDATEFRSLSAMAKPSNNAARWATTEDYPRADFVKKNEGLATFLVTVGADGAATGCRIVGSSGYPSLDKRTCELMLVRAAFHPAKDASGHAVPSFYMNAIQWRVPR